ncbi:MAG: hypothetical protein EOP48_20095 [Sphingobacteriales bacterium]|nr:MAG: hypothetical protein EOP48_20095 [Sphingobacteriales bacterium]
MKIIATILLTSLLYSYGQAQSNKKINGFLLAQYNRTVYDYNPEINSWGMGLTFSSQLNTNTRFKPVLEISGDIYLADDLTKQLIFPPPFHDLLPPDSSIDFVVNIFGGSSYRISNKFYTTLLGGPSLIDGKIYLGVKPSVGFYFSKDQKFVGRLSFTNIFNRIHNQDFGSIELSFGRRIF